MAKTKKKVRVRLTEPQKMFLVQRLAQFETPTEAAQSLSETLGVDIAPQSVERYDPTKRAGLRIAEHLRALFSESRDRFLTQMTKNTPLANKAVRVAFLANAAMKFKAQHNYEKMADMIERVAKEMGNVHTNKREHTGKDGGPIKYEDVDLMSQDAIDTELRTYGIDPESIPHPKRSH